LLLLLLLSVIITCIPLNCLCANKTVSYTIAFIIIVLGTPQSIMIDKGTEWNDVLPKFPIIQMKSTFNQVSAAQCLG
jgi:hypothetical protein